MTELVKIHYPQDFEEQHTKDVLRLIGEKCVTQVILLDIPYKIFDLIRI